MAKLELTSRDTLRQTRVNGVIHPNLELLLGKVVYRQLPITLQFEMLQFAIVVMLDGYSVKKPKRSSLMEWLVCILFPWILRNEVRSLGALGAEGGQGLGRLGLAIKGRR